MKTFAIRSCRSIVTGITWRQWTVPNVISQFSLFLFCRLHIICSFVVIGHVSLLWAKKGPRIEVNWNYSLSVCWVKMLIPFSFLFLTHWWPSFSKTFAALIIWTMTITRGREMSANGQSTSTSPLKETRRGITFGAYAVLLFKVLLFFCNNCMVDTFLIFSLLFMY